MGNALVAHLFYDFIYSWLLYFLSCNAIGLVITDDIYHTISEDVFVVNCGV